MRNLKTAVLLVACGTTETTEADEASTVETVETETTEGAFTQPVDVVDEEVRRLERDNTNTSSDFNTVQTPAKTTDFEQEGN